MSTEQDLELEALLLAAELEQEVAELEAGYAVKGKRRPLPHELRARVRFAELDRDVVDTAAQLERRAATVRDGLIDELAELGTDAALLDDPDAALTRLRRMASPVEDVVARVNGGQLTPLAQLVDDAAAQLEAELVRAAERGAAEVLEEARRQGLTNLPRVELDAADRAALRASARRLAEQPVKHGLGVAVEAAERLLPGAQDGAELIFGALDAVDQASTAATADVARQTAAGAQATGRTRAAAAAPRPARVYASELLDGNTCSPCSAVDGRTYRSLEDALEDYPGAGGFVFCEGGLRCRGTLVYVWDSEAPPTGNPGDPDPTPRGSSDPPDGPDGPVRPIPADDRTTFPRPADVVDDVVTALPAAPLAPATAPAMPPPAAVDPALEQLGDERLRGEYRAAVADGRTDDAIRYADELDRRQALGSAWRDPDLETWADVDVDLTPEQLLRIEDEAARAIDAAGGLDSFEEALANSRPGRRIDHVREDYNAEQFRRMMDAEAHGAEGIRKDRAAEFARKYGDSEVLWFGPARVGYYYASDELRAWWAIHGRESFAEYAVSRGIRDAKTVARAKAAALAREDAARLAEEGTGRDSRRRDDVARARAAKARARRATGAGAKLERDRKRLEREQRRAQQLQQRADRARVDAPPPRILDDGYQT